MLRYSIFPLPFVQFPKFSTDAISQVSKNQDGLNSLTVRVTHRLQVGGGLQKKNSTGIAMFHLPRALGLGVKTENAAAREKTLSKPGRYDQFT